MKKYEYERSYIPMDHDTSKSQGFLGFSSNSAPLPEPDIDAFLSSNNYHTHLNDYGKEGWELISTESVMLPYHDINKKINYQITRGFILFWKKEVSIN